MRAGSKSRSCSFAKASGRMTSRRSSAGSSTRPKEWCSSEKRRRRRRYSAPSAVAMKRPGPPTHGWWTLPAGTVDGHGEPLLHLLRGPRLRTVLPEVQHVLPLQRQLCLNGHEYAKQQLNQKGIEFEALDNGILSCEDPKRLQA